MPTPLPWRLKYYNGAGFVDAELRRWNGSSWVTCNMYYWDGASWVLCTDRTPPTETHNDQFNNTGSNTYKDNNTASGLPNRYQGYYDGVWGIQKCMYTFNYAAIDTALSGRVATYSCQIYLDNEHWWYGSGGTAVYGTSTATSPPATFNYNRYDFYNSHYDRDEASWRTVTNDLATWFAAQTARAITLYAASYDAIYYGYFTTFASLFFSYEK